MKQFISKVFLFFVMIMDVNAALSEADTTIYFSTHGPTTAARFKKDEETLDIFRDKKINTERCINKYIEENRTQLKLSFFGNWCNLRNIQEVQELGEILKTSLPEASRNAITHLHLPELTATVAKIMAPLFPSVTSLKLDGAYDGHFNDDMLDDISKAFLNIDTLVLGLHVNDQVQHIPFLWRTNLKSLTITGSFPFVSDRHGFITLFEQKSVNGSPVIFPKLEKLNLDRMFFNGCGLSKRAFPVLDTDKGFSAKGATAFKGWI